VYQTTVAVVNGVAISTTTRTEDARDCCDPELWWWTETFFIVSYIMMALMCLCGCAAAASAAQNPNLREAADRLAKGERPDDVYADLERRAGRDVSEGTPWQKGTSYGTADNYRTI
jgi:hypothetical protein